MKWRGCPAFRSPMVRVVVTVAALIYFALLGFVFFGHAVDWIVIAPNQQSVDPQGAERFVFSFDGRSIEVWKARSPGAQQEKPKALVLRFVGQGDRAERWATATARLWGKRPVEVWAMNYPGSGGSTGPPRLERLCSSAMATYDAAAASAANHPIFVQANSLGTAVALCLASQRPVAGLVLENPAPLRQIICNRQGLWNLWLLAGPAATRIPAELDAIANARHIDAPAIFVLAEKDTSIPPQLQRHVVDAYQGAKREVVVLGAGHSDPLTPEAARQLAQDLDWLWQRI